MKRGKLLELPKCDKKNGKVKFVIKSDKILK